MTRFNVMKFSGTSNLLSKLSVVVLRVGTTGMFKVNDSLAITFWNVVSYARLPVRNNSTLCRISDLFVEVTSILQSMCNLQILRQIQRCTTYGLELMGNPNVEHWEQLLFE